jgi:hypothetical protein
MSRAPRKPAVPRVQVGSVVGLRDNLGIVDRMVVVEDRGDLGPNGEQMVGLSFQVDGCDEEFYTETVVSRLTDPPTESWADQWWRLVVVPFRAEMRKERRKARRAATA